MVQSALLICIAYFIISYLDPYVLSWQCLNRPIVVAPIAGLILGDFTTGIIMGASLESIFMGISAIGGQIPADATTASIIAVAYTILTGSSVEAGIALSLPIGTVMASFNNLFTPVWAAFAPHWEKLAVEKPKHFVWQTMSFSAVMVLVPTVVLFIAVAFGVEGLNSLLAALPAWVMNGVTAASSMMVGVGFAILTTMIWSKETGYFFIVGYVLAKYLSLGTLPIAILGVAVAVTLFLHDKQLIDLNKKIDEKRPASDSIENESNDVGKDFF